MDEPKQSIITNSLAINLPWPLSMAAQKEADKGSIKLVSGARRNAEVRPRDKKELPNYKTIKIANFSPSSSHGRQCRNWKHNDNNALLDQNKLSSRLSQVLEKQTTS